MPTKSQPGVYGTRGVSGWTPSRASTSGRLTPAANTFTRTSPAFGSGISSSMVVITSGPPYRVINTRLYRMFPNPGLSYRFEAASIRFHKSGRPFLQHHFPIWIAVLIERSLVVLIPIIGLLYPLLRFIPSLYDWSMRSKVFRLYGEMRFLELQIERGDAERDLNATAAQLDRIEQRANQLKMPKAYASMVYSLLGHIALVRQRLKEHPLRPQASTQHSWIDN